MNRLGADIVVVPPEAKELAEDFILESKEKTFYMEGAVYEQVRGLAGVEKSTYQTYLDTIESGCCSIVEGQIVAFDPATDFVVSSWLDDDAVRDLKKGEIYVGSYVNEFQGVIYTATLFGREVKIAGALEPTGTGLDHGIFMRLDDLDFTAEGVRGQHRKGDISIVFLKLAEGADPEAVTNEIVEINPAVGIMTRASIGGGVKAVLRDISRIFAITIAISSILATLLASSSFSAMVNERRKELGIMRGLGARQGHVIRLFLLEASLVSLAGGIAGAGAGHLLIAYLARDFQIITSLGGVSITPSFSLYYSLLSILAGSAVCMAGSFVPIFQVARREPFSALKDG